MAAATITFTEEGRIKVAKALGLTHWFCIFPAVLCLITALYIQLVVSDKILFIENYNGTVLPVFLVFTGFFSFFGHILCGKAFWENNKIDKREKWVKFLLPAVIVTLIIFVFEMTAGIMCLVHVGELEDSLAAGITTAMKAYKNDMITKEEMDTLQIEYECCGSRSYQDWFNVAWVHPDYMSGHRKKRTIDDVPFSCCTPHVLRPCINHRVHDNDAHFNYDYRVKTTLYQIGCADKLIEFYENTLLSNGGAIILGLSFIQLIVAVIGRLFQTAVVTSLASDNEQGNSVGYLFWSVQEDKESELDTTTETEDSETTDDQPVDQLDTTTESYDADVALPNYIQMDGLDETPDEVIYENIRPDEVIYENLRPGQEDEEHIYHDEEVEQYLLKRFNQSKEHFENLSNGPTPIRSSVSADLYKRRSQDVFTAGSGIYDEPIPSPPNELETMRGIERTSSSPSKYSMRKNSSSYVSYDPQSGAHVISNASGLYENIPPNQNTDNSNIVTKRMSTNLSSSSNNAARKGRKTTVLYSPVSRLPEAQMNQQKRTGRYRTKADSISYYKMSDKPNGKYSHLSKTKQGVLRGLFSRNSNNTAKDLRTTNARFPPKRKSLSETTPFYRQYGSVDNYKYQQQHDTPYNLSEPLYIEKDVNMLKNEERSSSRKGNTTTKVRSVRQNKDPFKDITHGKVSEKYMRTELNTPSCHKVEFTDLPKYSTEVKRTPFSGRHNEHVNVSYGSYEYIDNTGRQRTFTDEKQTPEPNRSFHSPLTERRVNSSLYDFDFLQSDDSKPSVRKQYTPVKGTFSRSTSFSRNNNSEVVSTAGLNYTDNVPSDTADQTATYPLHHVDHGRRTITQFDDESESRRGTDDIVFETADFKTERESGKNSDSVRLPGPQFSISPIYPTRSPILTSSPSKPDGAINEAFVINLVPNPSPDINP